MQMHHKKWKNLKVYTKKKSGKNKLANGRMVGVVMHSGGDESEANFGLSANLEKAANWGMDRDCRR